MSAEDHFIDLGATDPATEHMRSPTPGDLVRNTAPAGSRRHGPAGRPSTDPHEVPGKLIEAWSRWAASRLR
jgi:hypothetical protein